MKKPDKTDNVPTTGHEWDGIQEFDNPMPKWWLYTFYACIIWGIGYAIAMPAWPLISSATPGVLGYSTRQNAHAEIAAQELANAGINTELETTDLISISEDRELMSYAKNAGASVFRTWCAQCHGSGAAGVQANGYPNLLDDDWLWGGDEDAIYQTIAHGVRNEIDEDARFSEMPNFGEFLEADEIDAVTNFVISLSGGTAPNSDSISFGSEIYAENCSACHGEAGQGDRDQGAPKLDDAIWLFGGSFNEIKAQITKSRNGVMPNWQGRLTEAEMRAVALYVHSLGGGE